MSGKYAVNRGGVRDGHPKHPPHPGALEEASQILSTQAGTTAAGPHLQTQSPS